MFVRRAVELDHDSVEGPRIVEFGPDEGGGDFVAHGGDGATHTDTALLNQIAERSQSMYDALAKAVPMKRIGTPDDIAPAVVFFAGDGASYITGQTLSVSGGLTMA